MNNIVEDLAAKLGLDRKNDNRTSVEGETARRALDTLREQGQLIEDLASQVEKSRAEVSSYRRQMGSAQVAGERAAVRAAEIEEACLRAAADRGLTGQDIQAQIVHDRRSMWLRAREEVWRGQAFDQVMGLAGRLARLDREATVTIGYVADEIAKATARGPRDAAVDRLCGKSPGDKSLPDFSIPEPAATPPGRVAETPPAKSSDDQYEQPDLLSVSA